MSELEALRWCKDNRAEVRFLDHFDTYAVKVTVWTPEGPFGVFEFNFIDAVKRLKVGLKIYQEDQGGD